MSSSRFLSTFIFGSIIVEKVKSRAPVRQKNYKNTQGSSYAMFVQVLASSHLLVVVTASCIVVVIVAAATVVIC